MMLSRAQQPAQPVITALGTQLPVQQIQVKALNLVIQDGPERAWTWTTLSTIGLRAGALA
jgi:hypothetical protein